MFILTYYSTLFHIHRDSILLSLFPSGTGFQVLHAIHGKTDIIKYRINAPFSAVPLFEVKYAKMVLTEISLHRMSLVKEEHSLTE